MSRLRRWLRNLFLFGLALTLVAVLGVGYFAKTQYDRITEDLPEDLSTLADWRPPTACEIVDRNGELLDTFYVERRFPVDHTTLPDHVWQAFVSSEDGSFFEHPGVDALGILRALAANLRAGRTVQGGSTLTQQVVKNTLLNSERSLDRKIKEAVLALRLEQELSKEQILALYLDLVYLGSGNYGVEAAARDYFGVPASELSVPQAAMLAGLVPAPSRMSPRVNEEEALRRRALVLRRMVDEGYLDNTDAVIYAEQPLVLIPHYAPEGTRPRAAYITAVRRDIRHTFGEGAAVRGLRVTVPMDDTVQAAAEEAAHAAVEAHLERVGPRVIVAKPQKEPPGDPEPGETCFTAQVDLRKKELHTRTRVYPFPNALRWQQVYDSNQGKKRALQELIRGGEWIRVCEGLDGIVLPDDTWAKSAIVVIENATGHVVAVADSSESELEGFIRGLQARRQPGSSFKPIVYAAALMDGMSQLDTVVDAPISFPAGGGKYWSPKNYSGGYYGSMTLAQALAMSSNTIAVRLINRVSPDAVVDMAKRLGIQTPLREGDLTIALGSSEVTPLDQATAYSTIARLGNYIPPTWIASAVSANGVDLTPVRKTNQAMSTGAAFELLQMLQKVVRSGTGRAADVYGIEVAGKTGTTNDNIDAWFVGMTPTHTIAVWVGTDGTLTLGAKETGGKSAAPAFRAVAQSLPPGVTTWAVPDDVIMIPYGGTDIGVRRSHIPDNLLPARVPRGPLPTIR